VEGRTPPLVAWNVAFRSMGSESGDQYLVSRTADGGVLVAVVDGLGHGPEAASAAKTAIAAIEAGPERELGARFLRCHERLRDTRGVVLSLALFATGSLTWLGVGNVDGVLLRRSASAPEQLLVRSGVVGRHLPSLELTRLPLARGDTLILATDGIQSRFAEEPGITFAPPPRAERILAEHGKDTDDALVLVVRYLGPED
jgi:serine/threonine protein phosphatase PrpC